MKKKKILNLIMVVVIILTAFCGVMAVGSLKGWFDKEQDNYLKVTGKTGIVTIERSGIAYEIQDDLLLHNTDILRTKISSEILVSDNLRNRFTFGANTQAEINISEDNSSVNISAGEIFADLRGLEYPLSVTVGDIVITGDNAVFTVSSQVSATTVYLHSGSATIEDIKNQNKAEIKDGQAISIIDNSGNHLFEDIYQYKIENLNDYQINKLQNCVDNNEFYFSPEDLAKVLSTRQAEKEKAQQEQILLAEQAKQELEKEKDAYEKAKDKHQQSIKDNSKQENLPTTPNNTTAPQENTTKYCTIEIRCDAILGNMGNLTPGKEAYVPSNGTILATATVAFTDGETVFDILNRACGNTGIQLEYSFTPMYDSYYIEGINNLYEFDCGGQSGWMYKVNGWFPNYGCSKYVVSEGDTITWIYTCSGLGADVGGNVR